MTRVGFSGLTFGLARRIRPAFPRATGRDATAIARRSSPGLVFHRSRPRRKARQPARDIGLEGRKLVAEGKAERGLFDSEDPNMEEQPEDRRVNQHPFVAENERFAEDDCDEADIYRIANAAIETGDNELYRRRDRRRRSEALPHEASERFDEQDEAKKREAGAGQAKRVESEKGGAHLPIRDRPRNEQRNRARCDQEKEQGSESCPEAPHGVSPRERAFRGFMASTIPEGIRIVAPRSFVVS